LDQNSPKNIETGSVWSQESGSCFEIRKKLMGALL